MRSVLVTGSAGFVGRHVVAALREQPGTEVLGFDLGVPEPVLKEGLSRADAIVHLAGVNRPSDPDEFRTGNAEFTATLCRELAEHRRRAVFVLSSSIQAANDTPYGLSKRQAEQHVEAWVRQTGNRGIVFRLNNVFGKWCRPNYNSVTATFCHNVARGLPIVISDEARELELVYIDDVVAAILDCLDPQVGSGFEMRQASPTYRITLGALAALIRSFRESRSTLLMPSLQDAFTRRLYATYISYLEPDDCAYALEQKADARGALAEFLKSPQAGQLFVSRTKPGVTRGNHFHHTKTEKFLVLEGAALIRLRPVSGGPVMEYRVEGSQFRVVDIPPGYTHSIENVGCGDLVTLFWASEIFDPGRPDTIAMPVVGS